VDPRAVLDTEVKRNNPFASAGDRTSIAQSSSPKPDTILTELPSSLILFAWTLISNFFYKLLYNKTILQHTSYSWEVNG
jgi:hypothetical protein